MKKQGKVLDNIKDHLHNCGIPEKIGPLIASSNDERIKELFYTLTMERFIHEIIEDIKRAKQITPEQVKKRKEYYCTKHNIQNIDLNTHSQTFRRGYCPLCDEVFSTQCSSAEVLLNHHVNTVHYGKKWTKNGEEAEASCKKHMSTLNQIFENPALKKYEDKFYKVRKAGPKPKGKKTYPTRYHCNLCEVKFTTSVGAMIAHAKNHEENDHTVIFHLKNNNTVFRPQEHTYNMQHLLTEGRLKI